MLTAAVMLATVAAAGAAEPQPQLEAVSAERKEQLTRRFPTVVLHKKDGDQVKGELTSYSTETGAVEGTYFIRGPEKEGPTAKLTVIPGDEVVKVEITGFVERTQGRRPEPGKVAKLLEAARNAGREAWTEIRRASQTGQLDKYISRQEEALRRAGSVEQAIAAVVKLRAAYVEAEGGRFAIRGNEVVAKRINDKVNRALGTVENPKVKTETGLILHTLKQAGERIKNFRDRPGGPRGPRRHDRMGP
jgi:hypothetical protein